MEKEILNTDLVEDVREHPLLVLYGYSRLVQTRAHVGSGIQIKR